MRLMTLNIYGYGKWVDTTFDLTEDVHLFYGMNEAGKSTLMSFIHSILFGFPTRNSTLLRYEPRESSRYGGKIIASDPRFGEVIIERIHGRVTGNVTVTLEDGTTGTDELLGTVLHGMSRESFQNIFSFSLTEIENVHQLNKNQLSRYLLNIGAHGTEYYLELVDQFQAEANKIYRPSGRVLALNKQLATLEKQEQKLAELEKRNEGYLSLIEQFNAENKEIESIETKQNRRELKLADALEFEKQLHIFEEIHTLEKEIKKINLPPLKEDGRYLLEEYKREKSDLHGKLQEVQVKTNTAKQTLTEPEMIETYLEHKEAFNSLENQLPELVEQLRDFENTTEKRGNVQKKLMQLEETLGITNQPVYPTPFNEQEKNGAFNWQKQLAEQTDKQQVLTIEMQQTDHEINLKNQKLDQYDELMWDNQEFKNAEEELNEPEPTKQNKGPSLLIGLLGMGLGIAAFFTSTPLNWVLGAAGIIAFIMAFTLLKQKSVREPNHFLEKEYAKQVSYKEEWQTLLTESDALQARYQELISQNETLTKNKAAIKSQWVSLLRGHHLPDFFELADADRLFAEVDQLQAAVIEDETVTKRLAGLKSNLEQETVSISEIMQLDSNQTVQDKISIFREYLTHVKTEIAREQEKLDQLNALKLEEKQLKSSIENVDIKIQHLIETAGIKEEAAFIELYKQKEKVDEKKSRVQFLKENAPTYDANKMLPNRATIERQITSFHKELEELKGLKNQAIRAMTNTKLSIEQLEKDGTYTEELQIFENEKATAQRLVDEWVSDKLAAGMIKQTLNQVTKDRFEEIITDAEEYFRVLTDGEYERIVFKEDELFVQMQNGHVVSVRVLSRGTAEPLYVAIRLAYIKNTRDMMELPVIMDDPFVNFDEKRRENMYRLLQELSADLQIIYFTFDDTAFGYFREDQMTNLEMRKKNG